MSFSTTVPIGTNISSPSPSYSSTLPPNNIPATPSAFSALSSSSSTVSTTTSSSSVFPSSSSSSSPSSSSVPPSSLSLPPPPEEKYSCSPSYYYSFKPKQVEQLMEEFLSSFLHDKQYDVNESGQWSKEMAMGIKNKLKELKLPRYKFLVEVVLGENKGAGIRGGSRQMWDKHTDKCVRVIYTNQSIYCMAVAFGVYLY